MKRNLDHNALPSAEEIKLYQEGKLSPGRTHELELLAEENPLLGDALEGYAALPLFGAVPGVTAAVSQQAAASTNSIVAAVKSGTAWWHLNGWVAGVVIGVAAALVIVGINGEESESKIGTAYSQKSISTNEPSSEIEETKTPVLSKEQISTNSSVVETANPIMPAGNLLEKEKPVLKNPTTASHNDEARSEVNLAEPIASIDLPTSALTSTTIEAEEAAAKLRLNGSSMVAVAMITIDHYRVADYSELRANNWSPLPIEPSGLPANFSDYNNKEADQLDNRLVSIPYLEYLSQCISAYDNKQYKSAIKGFSQILSQYKDDVNAQFYGAMSYYHHEQPVLALDLLEKAEKNSISAFREEIVFYKAKCLKMLNRTAESSLLFKQIAGKSGFYKTQAQKELID